MTCREFSERLYALHAGELSFARNTLLRLHAAFCPDCRRLLDGYTLTVDLAVGGDTALPADVAVQVEALLGNLAVDSPGPG